MPLTLDQRNFLKDVFQRLKDRPLEPGDDRYEPLYEHLGPFDPVRKLSTAIEFSGVESRQLFSGFRGSGKSTELKRLKKALEKENYLVYYADALDYMNPALPVDITDVLIFLAGAFSESVHQAEGMDPAGESYWHRFVHYLNKTQVNFDGFNVGLFKDIATLKVSLKEVPTVRQQIKTAMSLRLSELVAQVRKFFEDSKRELDKIHTNSGIVFLFDNLEQLSGNSRAEEEEVVGSVQKLFSQHLDNLSIPYFHVVYTAPPWLRFAFPDIKMEVLPSIVQWRNDVAHTPVHSGDKCLLDVIKRRFGEQGFLDFFGNDEAALPLVRSCGGSLRALLFLIRETILTADSFPVEEPTVQRSIRNLANSLLLMSTDDALWLARIANTREPELSERTPEKISRFTLFVNSQLVLFLRNGSDWYDVHPLIREHVRKIALRASESAATLQGAATP